MSRRRRVTQEMIDKMANLRRQRLSFSEVGKRLGCSERTVRRYVGHIKPELSLPPSNAEPNVEDPRQLRVRLLSEFMDLLYRNKRLRSLTVVWQKVDETSQKAIWGGPPSILFLNEAERQLKEQLDELAPLALTYLAQDNRSKHRFMREVIGHLYWDYVHWHQFAQNFDDTGEDWRPPRERPAIEIDEDDVM